MEAFMLRLRLLFPGLFFTLFGVRQLFDEAMSAWDRLWQDLRDSLFTFPPRPLSAIDAVIRFCTILPGILASTLFYGIKRHVANECKEQGIGYRVIRVDRAIDGFIDSQIEWFQTLSGTNDRGLLSVIATYLGETLWHVVKRSILLRRLLQAKTQQEMIETVLRSFRSTGRIFFVFALVRAVLAVVGWFVCLLSIAGMLYHFRSIGKHVLGQDTPRRKVRTTQGEIIKRRVPGGSPP